MTTTTRDHRSGEFEDSENSKAVASPVMGDLAHRFVEQLVRRAGPGSADIEISPTEWQRILEAGQGEASPERAIGRIIASAYEAVHPQDEPEPARPSVQATPARPAAVEGEYFPPVRDSKGSSAHPLDALLIPARTNRVVPPRRTTPLRRPISRPDHLENAAPPIEPVTVDEPTATPPPPLGFAPVAPTSGPEDPTPPTQTASVEPPGVLPPLEQEGSPKKRRTRSRSPFSPKLAPPASATESSPALGTTGPTNRAQWRTRSLFVPVVRPDAPDETSAPEVRLPTEAASDEMAAPSHVVLPVAPTPLVESEPALLHEPASSPEVAQATTRRPRISRSAQATAFTWVRNVGVIVLLFVGWQLWGTSIAQHHAQQDLANSFNSLIHSASASAATKAGPPTLIPATAHVPIAAEGTVVAQISIPSIGVSQFVVSGTATDDLAKGPGHYIGTAAPGQAGNIAIAGHRTTHGAPFNRLAQLAIGDPIVLTNTLDQHFTYKVAQTPFPVSPSDVSVLNDFGDNRITLTTCNPEFSAAQRLIVVATYEPPVSSTTHATRAPNPHHSYKLMNEATASWNWGLLPFVALEIGFLVFLGLSNRRLVTYFGPRMSWLILAPIWLGGLILIFQSLTTFLPASV
jgi:LPXTG-site transpeptidase (sortase) family protein